MKKLFLLAPIFLFFLSGCLDKKDRMDVEGPTIRNEPPPKLTKEDLAEQASGIKKDISTSQNAIQQNMQSLLGVSVGKLSDDLIKANLELKDLLHAEISTKIGEIRNDLTAQVASNNDLRAMIKAQMELAVKLEADIRSQIELNAKLEARVNALAAGQAGVNNRIDQKIDQFQSELKQELKAGRDVNNSTVQFNGEMLAALKSANDVTTESLKQFAAIALALLSTAATIVGLLLRYSRKRAEARAQEAQAKLDRANNTLQRALSQLPPADAAKVLPPEQGAN